MEVDSLVISLGLDPQQLRQAVGQVEAVLQQFVQRINAFAGDFQQGFNDAASSVGQASSAATQQAGAAGEAAQEAGQKFQDAGHRGGKGMDSLADKTRKAGAAARQTGSEMQTLGHKWGSFLGGMAARFAAPLAGALSAGAVVGSYMRDVSQVAQMTGRYSTQMEEWQKKRELLSRVTREDVELYRKGKLALLDFNFAMAGLSTTIMRALSPAIQGGIKILHSLSDWVRRNEPNIIRFVTVLAGTITAVLIPSFVKLGAAMLMNPLTWIIAGIVALALVIDSLVTYIRGGRSALSGLWSQFGTGKEILEKLKRGWDSFLGAMSRFKNLVPYIAAGAAAFVSWKAVIGTLSAVAKGINFVKGALAALRVVAATNPLGLFLFALAAIIVYFDDIVAFFKDFRKNIGDLLTVIGEGIKKLLPDWLKDFLGVGSESSQKADAVAKAAASGDKEAQAAFNMINQGWGNPFAAATVIPKSEDLTKAAIPASLTTDNTRNTTIQSDTTIQNMTIQTPATDADGILRDARSAADRRLAGLGVMAAEGGVRQ